VPVLGVGPASERFGLIATGEAFAALVGVVALSALVPLVAPGRSPSR
jgi:hypothetical protein